MNDRARRRSTIPVTIMMMVGLVGSLLTSVTGPTAAGAATAPTITSVSPTSGPVAGGTEVTITGTGLAEATGVGFGATLAATFTVVNDSTIRATSPVHEVGTVRIRVKTPAGRSAAVVASRFRG